MFRLGKTAIITLYVSKNVKGKLHSCSYFSMYGYSCIIYFLYFPMHTAL